MSAWTMIDGHAYDDLGNPMVKLTGCQNCGKGTGWMHPFDFFGAKNSGRNPDPDFCSRRCELQGEYAAVVEAQRALASSVGTEQAS